MVKLNDPFAVKAWGGDIADRNVRGWSWRAFEGSSLGEPGVGSLRRVISQRVPWYVALLLGVTGALLIGRAAWLQGVQGSYWRAVAEGNRIRLDVVSASRGLIVDQVGRPLAQNVASFHLVAVPAELPADEVERQELLTRVLGDLPTELLRQEEITELVRPSYLPVVVASPLSHELALRLMAKVNEGSGLRIEPMAERTYVGGAAIAPLVGYVGPVSAEEYKGADGAYRLTDTKGKVGLELQYENLLRGQAGVRQVEVDASGLERKVFATEAAVAGARLTLTVDAELQGVAYESLQRAVEASGRKGGSVVVLNPWDGAVRAFVSY
ncbi:MAG: hypothetical protein Q8P77_03040, partial [Candidatus Veblenbacteria bacterium]|nr:hypothetical protein [Candidatus Veblenbacteria bacterium]